jgi:S-adenosyl-L-methionine hydrolase (adenosine-forming)
MTSRPIVAFLTDFGTRDHYVGAMKGAALAVCPDATLVDITHDIPPQDVRSGALELAAAFSFFPPETIFVAVVDPGVGSTRRGIAAQAGSFRFVAPDNGLITLALRITAPDLVVELVNPGYARSHVSKTFEGRDRFAPTAAWLATGVAVADLGPPVHDIVQLQLPEPVMSDVGLRGEVLHVDHFGNLVTNIDRAAFERFAGDRRVRIDVGSQHLAGIVSTYAEASPGGVCALFGSSGRLEIAVNGGSAAGRLGLARGAPVVVTRT